MKEIIPSKNLDVVSEGANVSMDEQEETQCKEYSIPK